MKIKFLIAFATSLLLLQRPTLADNLGTSEEELARLKELNRSTIVVRQSDEEITKLMVGKWTTGRHDYIYRPNGTWEMLPAIKGSTHGTWHIQNHELIQKVLTYEDRLTFLSVSQNKLVLKNERGVYPYRYIRIP